MTMLKLTSLESCNNHRRGIRHKCEEENMSVKCSIFLSSFLHCQRDIRSEEEAQEALFYTANHAVCRGVGRMQEFHQVDLSNVTKSTGGSLYANACNGSVSLAEALRPNSAKEAALDAMLDFLDKWEAFAKGVGFLSRSTSEGLRVTIHSTKALLKCLSFYSLAKSPRGGNLSPGLLDSLLSAEEALVENEKHDDVVTMDAVEVAVDHADYVEKEATLACCTTLLDTWPGSASCRLIVQHAGMPALCRRTVFQEKYQQMPPRNGTWPCVI
ncbi:hypothetical protein MRX96_021095 [Rhipicephalus microplus]